MRRQCTEPFSGPFSSSSPLSQPFPDSHSFHLGPVFQSSRIHLLTISSFSCFSLVCLWLSSFNQCGSCCGLYNIFICKPCFLPSCLNSFFFWTSNYSFKQFNFICPTDEKQSSREQMLSAHLEFSHFVWLVFQHEPEMSTWRTLALLDMNNVPLFYLRTVTKLKSHWGPSNFIYMFVASALHDYIVFLWTQKD